MAYVTLAEQFKENNVRIMAFTEGTVLGPKHPLSVLEISSYIPIKNAVPILCEWEKQGAELCYITSRKTARQVRMVQRMLEKYRFPGSRLYYRERGQTYSALLEAEVPDILIEDDCKSIGGASQMCITNVSPTIRARIYSIAVPEFGGIDHLPAVLPELMLYRAGT